MTRFRPCFLLMLAVLAAGRGFAFADEGKVQAERMEFRVADLTEEKKIIVTLTPAKIRVDQPEDKFAFIYDVATQSYTGLELRDAHYWKFSWPEVQAAVQASKRYKRRLNDLNIEGLASYDITRPDPVETLPETPQFTWRTDDKTKKIGEYDCQHWLGNNRGGKDIEAWCVGQRVGGLKENLDRLKQVNEPMALVAVRPMLPPEFFVVVDSLYKAEVSPVEIAWGDHDDRTRLTLVRIEHKEVPVSLFQVPQTYLPSKLQALEGIVDDDKDKK